jgi:hypothetical protein
MLMRIHFSNRGHAERCLKDCQFILETALSISRSHRLPSSRLRNAFCQGLGYSSYQELKNSFSLHLAPNPTLDPTTLSAALTKSFQLGLEIADASGFRSDANVDHLAEQLARRALRGLNYNAPNSDSGPHLPPPSVPLYRATIEGRKFFVGFSVDGPYVDDGEDWVVIGASSIVELAAPLRLSELVNWNTDWAQPTRWVVVKYSHEIRIDLSYLSNQGRQEFSRQFGVPIRNRSYGIDDHGELFFQSPAFQMLCKWAKTHPELAKRIQGYCPYIPTLPAELARLIGEGI